MDRGGRGSGVRDDDDDSYVLVCVLANVECIRG